MRATHRVFNKEDPKAHFELCDLPDCVYLSEKGVCSKLNVKRCTGNCCSFKQSKDTREKSESWSERLCKLSEEQQNEIAKRYYGGKKPWKNAGKEVT